MDYITLGLVFSNIVLYLCGAHIMAQHFPMIEERCQEVYNRELSGYERAKLYFLWPRIAVWDMVTRPADSSPSDSSPEDDLEDHDE